MAAVLWLCGTPLTQMFAGLRHWADLATLAVLAVLGAAVYCGVLLALLGRRWLAAFQTGAR
jgi:hypothetical protein